MLGHCEVYVFGSFAEGIATGGSDVDVLIVAKGLPNFRERGEKIAKIEEIANLPLYHPFQIHLATKEEVKASPIEKRSKKEFALNSDQPQ